MIQYGWTGEVVPSETKIVGEIVVIVGGRSERHGKIEVGAIQNILLAAAVGEEHFVLVGQVLVDPKTCLRSDHLVQGGWVLIVVY